VQRDREVVQMQLLVLLFSAVAPAILAAHPPAGTELEIFSPN
jgi:hypothetical protein